MKLKEYFKRKRELKKLSKEKDKKRENIIISELNCEVIRILDY